MQLFTITIGQKRQAPRLSFEAIAEDSMTAVAQHVCLAEPGERVEVLAVRSVAESVTARTAAAWSVA